MNRPIPIALQLYSVRSDCTERGLPAVLQDVADMGYEGVEFAGFHNLTAREVKQQLDATGLNVAGAHTPINDLLGDNLDRTIAFNREIGNRYVICPGLPEEYRNSLEAWKKTAELFNQWSDRLRREGMWIGYHNHTVEFEPVEGLLPWDVFYGNTKTDVLMQLDTGNALRAGADVAPYIEKYPNRSVTVHLKEYSSAEPEALIGEGDVRWQEIFRLCQGIGSTEWYIVEQESYAHPPMECVKMCLENLRRMLTSTT